MNWTVRARNAARIAPRLIKAFVSQISRFLRNKVFCIANFNNKIARMCDRTSHTCGGAGALCARAYKIFLFIPHFNPRPCGLYAGKIISSCKDCWLKCARLAVEAEMEKEGK